MYAQCRNDVFPINLNTTVILSMHASLWLAQRGIGLPWQIRQITTWPWLTQCSDRTEGYDTTLFIPAGQAG